jgi:4-cresol dehydrogenase (hydroxylating)
MLQQSNFGIITSACIDLMPKPDEHMAAIIKIDSEVKLPQLIEALIRLRSRGIFLTVAHVGNRERSFITLAPLLYEQLLAAGEPANEATRKKAETMLEKGGFGPWSAAIGVLGTKAQLKLAKKEIRKAVRGFAKTLFLNDTLIERAKALSEKLSFIPFVRTQRMLLLAVEPVYGLTRGEATDDSLKSVFWAAGDFQNMEDDLDPNHSESGILFCLPIIPADGEKVLNVVRETTDAFARYRFNAAITLNLMTPNVMEGVVSLSFNQHSRAQVAAAYKCIDEMEARYMELGYPPYRVGINSMHQILDETDPFWDTVRDLKKVLDPNNVIAPGRYNLV